VTVPKRIELTQEQADGLLQRVKTNTLEQGDYELIKAIIDTLRFLGQAYEQKNTSIKRLLRMIFGARTETKKTYWAPMMIQRRPGTSRMIRKMMSVIPKPAAAMKKIKRMPPKINPRVMGETAPMPTRALKRFLSHAQSLNTETRVRFVRAGYIN